MKTPPLASLSRLVAIAGAARAGDNSPRADHKVKPIWDALDPEMQHFLAARGRREMENDRYHHLMQRIAGVPKHKRKAVMEKLTTDDLITIAATEVFALLAGSRWAPQPYTASEAAGPATTGILPAWETEPGHFTTTIEEIPNTPLR